MLGSLREKFRVPLHARPIGIRGAASGVEFESSAAAAVFLVVAGLVVVGNLAWGPSAHPLLPPPQGGSVLMPGGSPPSTNPPVPNSTASPSSTPGLRGAPGTGASSYFGRWSGVSNASHGGPSSSGGGPYPWPAGGVPASLVAGGSVGQIAPSFFQLVLQTPNLTSPWLWQLVNETPFTYFSFGDAGETTDQLNNTQFSSNGTAEPPSQANDSNFVSFCRTIRCHSIMSVPAEINNTSMDIATVQYVEQTLGFHPDYWAIGNEPQGWTHFDIPWTQWRSTDVSNTTPLSFAREVQRIVPAIRSVDPAARIIGIESADGGAWNNSQWLDEVAAVDGPNISSVAIHPYPDGRGPTNPTNASFFANLNVVTKFPNNYHGLQASVAAACGCKLPITVGEYNSALNGTYAPFEDSYPEVAYLAAGYAGAIRSGIPQVAFFSLQHPPASLINPGGDPYPAFELFSTFFRNLTLGTVLDPTVTTNLTGIFAVETQNGSDRSLFVVNTNTTAGLNLSIPAGWFGTGTGWSVWRWAPGYEAPQQFSALGTPTSNWVLPPQGVLLLNLTG